MWTVFLFLGPYLIFHLEGMLGLARFRFDFPYQRVIAIVIFSLCGLVGIYCGMLMAVRGEGTPLPADCPRRLIIIGLYRYVRNPMAMSSLTQGLCVAIWLGSPLALVYVAAGAMLWNYMARPREEADLERRFGQPFRDYRHAVRCWIPRITPYLAPQESFANVAE